MILKEQDDSCRDVRVLARLMDHPGADFATQRRIREEILRIESGDLGERSAAHTLKVHFGEGRNWIVLNDIRLAHNGMVAQIDHILINRLLDIWLLESKRVVNGVEINDHGEFCTFVQGKPRGMDSPIEQNNRHAAVVRQFIAKGLLRFPRRLGFALQPSIRSLVLISTGAIQRPATSFPGLETVIKSEQVNTVVQTSYDRASPMTLAKVVSPETLYEIGRQFLDLHRPIEYDWHRRLDLDRDETPKRRPAPPAVVAASKPAPARPAPAEPTPGPALAKAKPSPAPPRSNHACAICGDGVTPGVVAFCRAEVDRFAGRIFCIPCQPNFAARPGVAAAH